MENQSQKHLVRLKVDNIKPRYVTCVWLIFFIMIGVLYLLVFAIPDAILQEQYLPFNCRNDKPNNPYACKPFNMKTNPVIAVEKHHLGPKNQFLAVDLIPMKVRDVNDKFLLPLTFDIKMYSLSEGGMIQDTILEKEGHKVEFNCLNLTSHTCEQKTVAYIPEIDESGILVVINITNSNQMMNKIATFQPVTQTMSPKYTEFLLSLRYICLAISALVFCYYESRIKRLKKSSWVFEQKFLRWLGILVMLFNDPTYAITILNPNMASAFFSSLFVVTFFCALLLFWICCFQLLWLFSLVAYNLLNREYLKDPGFDFDDEHSDAFTAFKVIMILLLVVGLGWMFYGFAKIIKRYSTRIWRHKMFFSFSCYFIFCYFLFLFTGSLKTYNTNGTRVMLVIGVSNIYIWFLQFLYTPSREGVEENEKLEKVASPGVIALQYEMLDESTEQQNGEFGIHTYQQQKEERDIEANNDDRVIHNPDQIIFGIDHKDQDDEEGENKYPFEKNLDDEE